MRVRDHWQVENCLHFTKDCWWDEDRHYTARPGLAEVFATLTNSALTVLRACYLPDQPLRASADYISMVRPSLAERPSAQQSYPQVASRARV